MASADPTDESAQTIDALAEVSAEQALLFTVLQEISIIEHLARTRFERVMPEGLLASHFGVLNHLDRMGDDKPLSYLAFAFQVSKGTMTNTVQRLEQRGLVEVRPDPKDGRGKRVFITPQGRAIRRRAIAAVAPEVSKIIDVTGTEIGKALLPHLQTLRAVLDEQRNSDKPADIDNSAT